MAPVPFYHTELVSANASVRAPKLYKPEADFEAWLANVDNYLELNVERIWEIPFLLREKLRRKLGDWKTLAAYTAEFRSTRH